MQLILSIYLELVVANNWEITAHLSREEFDQLKLYSDKVVYVKPTRVKSFSNTSITTLV